MITEKNNVFYCDCGFSWRRGMSGSHNCEDGLRAKLTDMAVQLANAESKCRELAAENVTLNDKMNKLATWPGIEFYSSAWEFCNLDGNDALEFMCDVKTPATDAFLAEVRAQGVEGFLKFCGEENSVFVEAKAYYRSLSDAVDEFAAQLRKGAAL
ncbi:hypothetical protein OGW16_15330 [Citrobacter sp. Ce104]|uniref:hypothetical protein n=1 Tax=Citrobacter sp. Ce104 TaxID=2985040 RepID=UPI0025787948|nr:hypothetical protein [Citrobacter sp. Ce104]MDM3280749.1 hypothetical protein [Citrobacter sp. Ce104]